ncbi:MAG: DNA-binding protein [Bacteroidetes bacterium]|nr:DNA-binding protein [Bacteroidota bacterium]
MSIRYRITQRKNTIQQSSEVLHIMQAVTTGTVDLETISYEISQESTLSRADIYAVLIALGGKLQQHLADGKMVDLGDLGKYRIGFKGVAEKDRSQLSVKRIKRFYLNYQPSLCLKHWLKSGVNVYKEGSRSQ